MASGSNAAWLAHKVHGALHGHAHDREIIATHIIDLAPTGLTDAKAISDRVVAETKALRLL